jgi:hypothetical protein
MKQELEAIVALIAAPAVTDADLAALRREVLADRSLSVEEAEALFALDAEPNAKCEGWTAFFVEALTDFLVWQQRPTGILAEAKAEWLMTFAGGTSSVTVMALLVNLLAECHKVPTWFLAEVRGLATRNWAALDDVRCGAIPACEAA